MIKKVLVIIPHSDDEISLVGTIINQFQENNIEVIALFVTNGDYDEAVSEERMKETFLAIQKMNFSRVLFLGYPDNPGKEYKHIYDIHNEYVYTSISGNKETYGIDKSNDYRFSISGHHNQYYVKNIEEDIKECLLQERADLLIYPDWDVHPDHRMTSLLVDTAVAALIKEQNYRPIILKKFAYAGVWFGRRDYYYYPMCETIVDESEIFPNDFSQAIRVRVDAKIYPLFLWKSPIYSYCKAYKTQNATERCERIVNADALYFYRDTSNLALDSKVIVSSGDPEFINDFMVMKPRSIIDRNSIIQDNYQEYSWIPDSNDRNREIKFVFNRDVDIKQMSFYLPVTLMNQKIQLLITMDNGYSKEFFIGNKTRNNCILDHTQKGVRSVCIQIKNYSGDQCGFSEIEIFSKESVFPWASFPFVEYRNDPEKRNVLVGKCFMSIYKISLYLKYDLFFRFKQIVKKILKR